MQSLDPVSMHSQRSSFAKGSCQVIPAAIAKWAFFREEYSDL